MTESSAPAASPETGQIDPVRVARGIRSRSLRKSLELDGGYLSQSCSSAEILAVLYTRLMRLGPSIAPPMPPPYSGVPGPDNPDHFPGDRYNGPHTPELDRFIFSPTHYSLSLYCALVEIGRLDAAALDLVEVDGHVMERIGAEHSPGIAVTSGSFGQSLSQAAGIAFARREKGETGHTWIFMSDGELQEGQTWETVASCSFHGIDNLTAIIDVNGQQCDGEMESIMQTEPIVERLEAFGANVLEIDGNDIDALTAIPEARIPGKTLFAVARTNPMCGMPELEPRLPELHYVIFSDPEEKQRFERRLSLLEGAAL